MIRSFNLLAPRPDIDIARFHDHWRHPHGTLGRRVPGLETVVQAHRIHSDLLGPDQDEFAGVAIVSVDDSAAGMAERFSDPAYLVDLAPDEPHFMDVARSRLFATDEEILVSRPSRDGAAHPADPQWDVLERPTSVQLLQFVHLDGARDWAGEDDIALGRRLGAFRHARNHPTTRLPGEPAFRGARQLWWPTVSRFEAAVAADPAALRELISRAGHAVTMLAISERFLR